MKAFHFAYNITTGESCNFSYLSGWDCMTSNYNLFILKNTWLPLFMFIFSRKKWSVKSCIDFTHQMIKDLCRHDDEYFEYRKALPVDYSWSNMIFLRIKLLNFLCEFRHRIKKSHLAIEKQNSNICDMWTNYIIFIFSFFQ